MVGGVPEAVTVVPEVVTIMCVPQVEEVLNYAELTSVLARRSVVVPAAAMNVILMNRHSVYNPACVP